MLKKIFYFFFSLTILATLTGGGAFFWFIVLNPGDEIRQENIKKILAMESPVFYADGQNKIGVFFRDAHRQYISYNEIPKNFVNGIVASEDNDFFSHFGVDLPGVLRALIANIKAGRVVQGGSTITQQTAKNLFKRKDRSIRSKLKELLFALRLEYHYPKEKIMEFYSNQFYVSGNGHGLGVAARYFFDKAPIELDNLESAFIAGSVKRPNYYNPFIKHDEADIDLAKQRAKQRAGYVLKQMYKLGMIDVAEYQKQIDRDIPFKKGRMVYSLNTLMDTVKEALSSTEIEEALAQNGIDNVATSGIRIISTVEKALQENSVYALRKELSRLDVRLRGYVHEDLRQAYADLMYEGDLEFRPKAFLFGRISEINLSEEPFVMVSFARSENAGRINAAGLMPLVDSLKKWEKQRWSEANRDDLKTFLADLKTGDKVFVSIRGIDSLNNEYLLDLEKYPQIQGAVLAMKKGSIRAMTGGAENHFYNRAITAKRPMGSVIKPLVYAAAMQLGWSSIDALNNKRNIFVFQGQPYFTKPDHHSDHEHVSMSWAGTHSENLATVWLLYHLCDRLSPAQFKETISYLGLGRDPDESYEHYKRKIRDDFGMLVDRDLLYGAAFKNAVTEIEPDLIFSGRTGEYEVVKDLHYGTDFASFLETTLAMESSEEYESEASREANLRQEIETRKEILKNNFISFMQLRDELRARLADISGRSEIMPGQETEERLGVLYRDQQTDKYIYASADQAAAHWNPVSRAELTRITKPSFFGSQNKDKARQFFDNVLIEGVLTVSTIDLLNTYLQKEYERLSSLPPYSFEVLASIQEFRVLTALHYVTGLGYALGINSQLDPVLSFPLGSNVISILETARAYEGLLNGVVIYNGPEDAGDHLAIIKRIENSDGETIYSPEPTEKRVIDAKTSLAVSHILRNVVKFGTGRAAAARVRLQSRNPDSEELISQLNLRMPLFGKTGTANRYTNSAFCGYVPGVSQNKNSFTMDDGYTIAAYVGFDDNSPMVRNSTHISGASGALPVWARLANSVILETDYASKLDLVDISFITAASGQSAFPLQVPELGQTEVPVSRANGMPITELPAGSYSAGAFPTTVIAFSRLLTSGEVEPVRYFQPFWLQNDLLSN